MSRTKNVKRNIVYGLLQSFVSQALPFIVRTILIYRWGIDYLGLNSLFASILSVLSLMELGFGTAVVYSMYRPASNNDTDEICAYLAYYKKIYRYIGIAIFFVGLGIMPFLNHLIRDTSLPGNMNIYICYLIFLSDSVISYLLYGYITCIPTAYQRRDILSRIDISMSVLQCIVKSAVLLISSTFYCYLLCMPLITIVRNLVNAYVIRKKYPELICKGEISSDQKHDLNKKVYGILVNRITAVSRNSIDSLCVSTFLGLAATGIYSNYYLVMTVVSSISVVISSSMKPSVGNSIAVESRDKNYSDMRRFDFIYMAGAGWATVCMLCLYQPFMVTWVGKELAVGMPVVIGFSAYYYILMMGVIRWAYQEGAGQWYECRYIMLGEAAANLILNIFLCKLWGMTGIILATILTVFVTNYFLCPIVLFRYYFQNGKLIEYWKDQTAYAATMLIIAGTNLIICSKLLPIETTINGTFLNSVICLGGRLLICTLISIMVFWIIWHKSSRYNNSIEWLRKLRTIEIR